MPEFLKTVDTWFLIIALVICGGGFLYMVNRSFGRFDATLTRFEVLFDKVFDKHERLDKRLSKLEGAHESNHIANHGRREDDE